MMQGAENKKPEVLSIRVIIKDHNQTNYVNIHGSETAEPVR